MPVSSLAELPTVNAQRNRPHGPAARVVAAQEPAPAYEGPMGLPHRPVTARQVEYAPMLRALRVPAMLNSELRLNQIQEILIGQGLTARDVYEVLRDLDHTVEVPSPDRLPSPAFMRRSMAAMLEIRLNYTRAQALDLVDKGRSANIGAIAGLIGAEVMIGTIGAIEGAGAIYVFNMARAGYVANAAIVKGAVAGAGAMAKGKAAALAFGWGGVAVLAGLWTAKVLIATPFEAYKQWHLSPEALFTMRSKDAAIVSHVVDGVVFRQAPEGYYDQHHAQ